MIADLFVALGFLILADGPTIALVLAAVLVVFFAAVIAVHHLRREKPTTPPVPASPEPRVYGSRRPSQHRRTSFVRHVANYSKTGAVR